MWEVRKPAIVVDVHRAPVATLRDVPLVAEARHQLGPGTGDAGGAPDGRT